jgi:hypothetical protein
MQEIPNRSAFITNKGVSVLSTLTEQIAPLIDKGYYFYPAKVYNLRILVKRGYPGRAPLLLFKFTSRDHKINYFKDYFPELSIGAPLSLGKIYKAAVLLLHRVAAGYAPLSSVYRLGTHFPRDFMAHEEIEKLTLFRRVGALTLECILVLSPLYLLVLDTLEGLI